MEKIAPKRTMMQWKAIAESATEAFMMQQELPLAAGEAGTMPKIIIDTVFDFYNV